MDDKTALFVIAGVLAAGALVYLATRREINATITAEDPTITYRSHAPERPVGGWEE